MADTTKRRRSKRCLRLVLTLLLAVGSLKTSAQSPISKADQIEAVFLFNFTQFIDWPTNAFAGDQAPFVIGVLGEDPFGPFLDETVRGEKVDGHALTVQRYRRVEEIQNCEILFVSQSESGKWRQILAGLHGRSTLTVADFDGFSRAGGMVRFITEQNKIHLQINLTAARANGLNISSKLLRLADIVETGKD